LTTFIHGLVSEPSTLIDLAEEANALLPDFLDAALAEGRRDFPQVIIADDFETSYIVPLAMHIIGLRPTFDAPEARGVLVGS
jgi:hypothetical protein